MRDEYDFSAGTRGKHAAMINWFGPQSWGAPVCATTPRCVTPVGVACARCAKPIAEDDSGITMPSLDAGPVAFHYACHLKSVLPHWLWPSAQLVPDETDGLVDGLFACPSCGMEYRTTGGWNGWVRRLL